MKILVRGGAGFIGGDLVDYLVRSQRGQLCILDNFSRGNVDNLSFSRDSIRVAQGDHLDADQVRAEMVDVDIVFHLATLCTVLDCE